MTTLLLIAISLVWVVPGVRSTHVRKEPTLDVDPGVVLDLASASLRAGSSVPAMLRALANALGEDSEVGVRDSAGLDEVAHMLIYGASWEEAWRDVRGYVMLRDCLRPAWVDGAAPIPLLDRAARTFRLTRQRRAKEAAARLGAKLVLPLGLCFLPAFILLGVVPVVASAALSLF